MTKFLLRQKKSIAMLVLSILIFSNVSLAMAQGARPLLASIFDDPNKDKAITFTDFKGELAAPNAEGYAKGLTQATDARTYVLNVTNFALGFLGLAAVLIIIYGGYLYVISAGAPEQQGKGKKAITFALTGLLIVMSSFAIVNTILNAPSGSEKGVGSGSGGPSTIHGVAAGERFFYLAKQLQSLENKFKSSINFHNDLALAVQNYKDQLQSKYDYLSKFATNCQSPGCIDNDTKNFIPPWLVIEPVLKDYMNSVNQTINILQNYLSTEGITTEMDSGIRATIKDLRRVEEAYKAAFAVANSGECMLPVSGKCLFEKQQEVYKAFIDPNVFGEYPVIVLGNLFKGDNGSLKKSMESIKAGVVSIKEIVGHINPGLLESLFEPLTSEDESTNKLIYIGNKNFLDETQRADAIINAKTAVTNFEALLDVLKTIKSVDVVLTADMVTGNAPMIVNFSSVGSSDPSGRGISKEQIHWDLGSGNTDTESKTCKDNEAIASCTFNKPGTYRITLRIDPSKEEDPVTKMPYNQEIASGISYIDIKVNPASSKINLSTTAGGTTEKIIEYDKDGKLLTDQNAIYALVSEAKKGIVFNAEETTLNDGMSKILGQDGVKIKWNFGTKSDLNDVMSLPSDKTLNVSQEYPSGGTYPIVFEVTDKNGVIDRKMFTINVGEVAPRITNAPAASKVNSEVTFDGSNTTSEGGQVDFSWTVSREITSAAAASASPLISYIAHAASSTSLTLTPTDRNKDADSFSCSLPAGKDDVLKCNFKRAGQYKIKLAVVDQKGKEYTTEKTIKITSNAPEAGFQNVVLDKSNPAVYKLDANSLSFDPDEQGDNSNLEYSWEITPVTCSVVGNAAVDNNTKILKSLVSASANSCDKLKKFSKDNALPVVRFDAKGTYTVNLVVRSTDEPDNASNPAEKNIDVNSILDASWGDMTTSSMLKQSQEAAGADTSAMVAPITFQFSSQNAVSYDLDFGDGSNESKDMSKSAKVTHNYTQAGKFKAKLTLFDVDNAENSISKSIFIGAGNAPISTISVLINGNEVDSSDYESPDGQTFNDVIVVSRSDNLTFDAGKSVNTDGTGRRLQFAWDINDKEKQSTSKTVNYQFGEISSSTPLKVKLKVTNEKDATQSSTDSVNMLVIGKVPTLRSLTAVPEGSNLTTPVNVRLNAIGSNDADGKITQYKWWYYLDQPGVVPAPDDRLGLQISTSPSVVLTLGTRGVEGEKPKYKFGLEMTDNDNNVVATDAQNDAMKLNIIPPSIQVTNGPNKAPVAKFTVNQTSINVGEAVTFTSTSSDPDQGGSIKEYRWDFGDGVKEEGKSSTTHTYKKANIDGYKAKLTVVDDNASETTSDPIKIYVDAVAQPPVPGFTVKTTAGSKDVQFNNTSTADADAGAKITKYSWDFDVNNDFNGDGIKDNDIQSGDLSPNYTYPEFGIYRAKLTVQDDQGQIRSVVNFVNVKAPEIPKATVTPTSSTPVGEGSNSASKAAGANLFEASNRVDPTLLLVSLSAYAILMLLSRRKSRENQNS